MQTIPPVFFDLIVIALIGVGAFFALRRLRTDFKRGARFPNDGDPWYRQSLDSFAKTASPTTTDVRPETTPSKTSKTEKKHQ
ncbi:MAG TPA: hypothetical protein PLD47_05995 [Aggregatilineales bacterium]|nr:hypothetical protein [Anaerolineales bacterium]HRE47260.1 hypothetical protein [Aggregatilineales bacterium]